MTINIDKNLLNADWTKQTWDLLDISSKEDLLEYLERKNISVEHFKELPIYKFNNEKIEWLKYL